MWSYRADILSLEQVNERIKIRQSKYNLNNKKRIYLNWYGCATPQRYLCV